MGKVGLLLNSLRSNRLAREGTRCATHFQYAMYFKMSRLLSSQSSQRNFWNQPWRKGTLYKQRKRQGHVLPQNEVSRGAEVRKPELQGWSPHRRRDGPTGRKAGLRSLAAECAFILEAGGVT